MGRRRVVQGIVHELEGNTAIDAQRYGRLTQAFVRSGQHRAAQAGRLDQMGGLAGDDGQVGGKRQVGIAEMGKLQDFTRGGLKKPLGQDGGEFRRIIVGHDPVGQGEQGVAGQNGVGGAEAHMGCFATATQAGAVHDVVMARKLTSVKPAWVISAARHSSSGNSLIVAAR